MIINPTRADLREIFLSEERRVDIFFYTSNLVKFLHAHTVFQRFGIPLSHFKSKGDPYSEDYSGTKEHLLARAIDEIKGSVGSGSLFFVEDTSVTIDALSSPALDFPGLAVKEWFARTSFQEPTQRCANWIAEEPRLFILLLHCTFQNYELQFISRVPHRESSRQ